MIALCRQMREEPLLSFGKTVHTRYPDFAGVHKQMVMAPDIPEVYDVRSELQLAVIGNNIIEGDDTW